MLGELCGPALVPSPKRNAYESGPGSGSIEPEASSVTLAGAMASAGVATSAATGGWPPGLNSNAPRSEYAIGPSPVFDVAGSSKRVLPPASVEGHSPDDELPLSIAGEPACRWKSPLAGFTNFGSSWSERESWPLAAR